MRVISIPDILRVPGEVSRRARVALRKVPAGRVWRRSLLARFGSWGFALINRFVPWHRLPRLLGVVNLIALRSRMREENLYDTSQLPSREPPLPTRATDAQEKWRTADGTYNDLEHPRMGCAGARFGRNIPLENAWPEPEPRLLEPSPRVVSNRLLAREKFVPAPSLNLLAAAWIQFMVHDWFDHGPPENRNAFRVPLDKERGDSWHEDPMLIRRTPPDRTRIPGADEGPPTYVNTGSHWWDASQIYGNSEKALHELRFGDGLPREDEGKLLLVDKQQRELLPKDARTRQEKSGVTTNWWLGLSLVHTLFAREHNAIAEQLRKDHPDWSGEALFQTARLINTALLAKIHTVEWTPAVLGHPTLRAAMESHWWGMLHTRPITRVLKRFIRSEALRGLPGSRTEHFGVPFALTEEFVSVYRMHSMMPDTFRRYRVEDGSYVDEVNMQDIIGPVAGADSKGGLTEEDLCYSFGINHPGALVLHNYPEFLRHLRSKDSNGQESLIDLAAIDVMRDRERGVPRYNDFRKLMHLKPVRSFEELTRNGVWARQLREVYGDIDRVDLQVGMLAEDKRPQGFGISETAFRVFVLMASRRLTSDRFFTTDYNVSRYTQWGMDWINANTMASVLSRHYPKLAALLKRKGEDFNAFTPWASAAGQAWR